MKDYSGLSLDELKAEAETWKGNKYILPAIKAELTKREANQEIKKPKVEKPIIKSKKKSSKRSKKKK